MNDVLDRDYLRRHPIESIRPVEKVVVEMSEEVLKEKLRLEYERGLADGEKQGRKAYAMERKIHKIDIDVLPNKKWNQHQAEKISRCMDRAFERSRIDLETKTIYDKANCRLTNLDTQLKAYVERCHSDKICKTAEEALFRISTINGVVLYLPGCELYLAVSEQDTGILVCDLLDTTNVDDSPVAKQVVHINTPHKLVLLCKKGSIKHISKEILSHFKLERSELHLFETEVGVFNIPIVGTYKENYEKYQEFVMNLNNTGEYDGCLSINKPNGDYLYLDLDAKQVKNSTKDGVTQSGVIKSLVDRVNLNVNHVVNITDNSVNNSYNGNTHSFNDSTVGTHTFISSGNEKMDKARIFVLEHPPVDIKASDYLDLYRESLKNVQGVSNKNFKEIIISCGYIQEKVSGRNTMVWKRLM